MCKFQQSYRIVIVCKGAATAWSSAHKNRAPCPETCIATSWSPTIHIIVSIILQKAINGLRKINILSYICRLYKEYKKQIQPQATTAALMALLMTPEVWRKLKVFVTFLVFPGSIENSRTHSLSKHTPFQQLANLSEYGSAATYAACIVGMVQDKTWTLPTASVFLKEWEPNHEADRTKPWPNARIPRKNMKTTGKSRKDI